MSWRNVFHFISLLMTLSAIKWMPISLCFVLAYWTGFDAHAVVMILSYHKTKVSVISFTSSSTKSWCIQITLISYVTMVYIWSFRRSTYTCFLLDGQWIRFPLRQIQKPLMDLLSSILLAQSKSAYPFEVCQQPYASLPW